MLTTSIHLLERMTQPDDQPAWERFVSLYSPLIFRWGITAGLCSDEAFDLVQDVFVVLVQELPSFRYDPERGKFRSWLKALATRQLSTFRSRRTREAGLIGAQHDLADSTADAALWEEDEYREYLVRRALAIMQSDFEELTWRACWLHTVSGRTAAEVGRELGMTEGAVYVAKGRVLRRLREELNGLL
ncbi:MAG: sigma-70 family RNA polymerase sigma factor [Planctomycetaceae bacterium]|nr:sigma-70 family RNA polymerase sigma factor [Planctomycetaceae bacterium]